MPNSVPVPDFWPDDFGEASIRTPVSILKEEASFLGPKTRQLIKAEIMQSSTTDGRFIANFTLTVPGLNNYRYQLFQVMFPITLYPLQVIWQNRGMTMANQDQFIAQLREIITSPDTIKLVQALLAQVTGPTNPSPGG